ncbi:hypothetical protein RJ639_010415 [Escallonia herrerae]|uniref:Uncharacterized protein n=1 Tax=Escallonia herrerae TaxID=1293975 RepID=A0AA89ASM2_9ASTE|nr:hypothetical protein RJ639_010415 [Escallonia herrerae]
MTISSQKHHGKSSGQNSSIKIGKSVPSAKALPRMETLNASTSPADQSKHSFQQSAASAVKEERLPVKPAAEDSADDMPISTIISYRNFDITNTRVVIHRRSTPSSKPSGNKHEYPDDKVLLSSIFPPKSIATSGSKFPSDGKEPMGLEIKQRRANHFKRCSTVVNEVKSSVKKPKLSDTSTLAYSRHNTTKAKPKVDDDDHVPIATDCKEDEILRCIIYRGKTLWCIYTNE